MTLPNSIPDAQKIAKVLSEDYQFKTEVVKNPTLDEIDDKLYEYAQKFKKRTFAKDG